MSRSSNFKPGDRVRVIGNVDNGHYLAVYGEGLTIEHDPTDDTYLVNGVERGGGDHLQQWVSAQDLQPVEDSFETKVLAVVDEWTDEEVQLAFGFTREEV